MTDEKPNTSEPKKKLGIFLCDWCDKEIGCNTNDPANITSLGQFHSLCMKEAHKEENK